MHGCILYVHACCMQRPSEMKCGHAFDAPMRVGSAHVLSPSVQYHILREKGTEPPGSGQYNKHYEKGIYKCAGCGTPLYK